MASYPAFNPNNLTGRRPPTGQTALSGRVRAGLHVQGIVTAAAALEEKLATPSDLIHTSPGRIQFGARVIDEAKGHNYGTLTFEDVIVKSSNVGAIKIGLELGAERLSKYVTRFGFGPKASGPDFRGESRGIVVRILPITTARSHPCRWATRSGVTPLQMAAAVSVVANGGELIRAAIGQGIGSATASTPPVPNRSCVASSATGTAAAAHGNHGRGREPRHRRKRRRSRASPLPARPARPRRSCRRRRLSRRPSTTCRSSASSRRASRCSPSSWSSTRRRKVSPYGGTVAAPVFQKIAAAVLRQRGVPPSLNRPAPLLIAHRDPRHSSRCPGPRNRKS